MISCSSIFSKHCVAISCFKTLTKSLAEPEPLPAIPFFNEDES